MMMINSEKFPVVYFGILKAGGVVINMNTAFTKREVSFILNNSGARLFIFGENFAKVLEGIEQEVPSVENFVCVGENPPAGTLSFFDLIKNSSDQKPPVAIDEADLCSIIYTSGTTGTPRGAVFDHRAVITNARDIGALNHRYHHFTRNLVMMPLFHSAPLHTFWQPSLLGEPVSSWKPLILNYSLRPFRRKRSPRSSARL
jgi:acyl-CoA synthetase (AMP-forming)/AMP-acid ligase II